MWVTLCIIGKSARASINFYGVVGCVHVFHIGCVVFGWQRLTQCASNPIQYTFLGNRKHTRISAYLLPHDETKLAHGYPCTFAASHPNHQNTWTTVTAEADNQAVIDRLLEHQTPVFTQTWPVDRPDCSDTLMFDLNPKGDKPVVANVIAIELIGKHVEQMPGSGYYACVEQLDCQGIPLYHSLADVRRAHSASWASVLWDPR